MIKKKFLRYLVKNRRLSPKERLANRLGYLGTGFIMISPYLLPYGNIGAITYIIGGVVCTPQVWVAKQWNLVVVNLGNFQKSIFSVGVVDEVVQKEEVILSYSDSGIKVLEWD